MGRQANLPLQGFVAILMMCALLLISHACAFAALSQVSRDLQQQQQQQQQQHQHRHQPEIIFPQTPTQSPLPKQQQQQQRQQPRHITDRRNTFFCMGTRVFLTILASSSIFSNPSSAFALKQKNDVLCGTGFFEHIYEYKCTSIGDIEDEGVSKELSRAETGVTDNLIGKLGFDTDDVFESVDYNNKNNKIKTKEKKVDKITTTSVKE